MPLSEHEQRMLEQIERALYAEDPKFASTVRTTDLRRHYRRRVAKGVVLFVVGLAVLLGGTVVKAVVVGVIGFLLMLGGALLAVAGYKHLVRPTAAASALQAPRGRIRRSSGPARTGLRERMEERWRRRRDEREGY